MKIVYISRVMLPSKKANSVNIMKMCSSFASLGHEVFLLTPFLEEKGKLDIYDYYGVKNNFKIIKIDTYGFGTIKKHFYSSKCLSFAKKVNADLVYGRTDTLSFYKCLKSGFNVAFERHDPFKGPQKFYEKFFLKIIKSNYNYKLITNSNALKQIYLNECNIPNNLILSAANGTDIILDNSLPSNVKIDNTKINIGYVGSLFKGRGIDIIIELVKRFPECIFHIIGGSDKDLNYWKSTINCDNLIFHGFVKPKETYKYRNMCHILLAPYQSSDDGNRSSDYMSPIKVFEYMSSKKPIVCSDFPVLKEVINEKSAIFVEHNNVDKWEEAIKKLIENVDLRNNLSFEAFEIFKNNFTWIVRAEKILNFVNKETK